jgi:predicted house-cleaning NTP pyrophosphatase (Maf/HAM1 superfamily)
MNADTNPPLILASTSPFRKELLGRLMLPFDTATPDVDESRMQHEPAIELVRRLARQSSASQAIMQQPCSNCDNYPGSMSRS